MIFLETVLQNKVLLAVLPCPFLSPSVPEPRLFVCPHLLTWEQPLRTHLPADLSVPAPPPAGQTDLGRLILTPLGSRGPQVRQREIARGTRVGQHCSFYPPPHSVYIGLFSQSSEGLVFCVRNRTPAIETSHRSMCLPVPTLLGLVDPASTLRPDQSTPESTEQTKVRLITDSVKGCVPTLGPTRLDCSISKKGSFKRVLPSSSKESWRRLTSYLATLKV